MYPSSYENGGPVRSDLRTRDDRLLTWRSTGGAETHVSIIAGPADQGGSECGSVASWVRRGPVVVVASMARLWRGCYHGVGR